MVSPTASTPSAVTTIVFRVLAGLSGLALLVLSVPFLVTSFTNDADAPHRVHNVEGFAAYGLLLGLPLLVTAWKPAEHPAVFRLTWAAAVGALIAGIIGKDFVSGTHYLAPVLLVVFLALHPFRARLLDLGAPIVASFSLWAVATIPAVIYAVDNARIQPLRDPATDTTGHWEFHHWSGAAACAITIVLAGMLSSFRARDDRLAGWLVGVAAALVGVAWMAFPDYPSSPGSGWGVVALVVGVVAIAITYVATREPST
jgi:hypothetical protein